MQKTRRIGEIQGREKGETIRRRGGKSEPKDPPAFVTKKLKDSFISGSYDKRLRATGKEAQDGTNMAQKDTDQAGSSQKNEEENKSSSQ